MAEREDEKYLRDLLARLYGVRLRKLPESTVKGVKTADYELLSEGSRVAVLEVKRLERTARTAENGWRRDESTGSMTRVDNSAALKEAGGAGAEPSGLAELTSGTITLKDRKSDGTTTMVLFNRDRSDTVTLKLDTYVSGFIFPFLPKERQIARFVSPMFSFAWHQANPDKAVFTTTFEMPWDGTFTLTALSRVCRAARLYAEARKNGLLATLTSDLFKIPLAVDLSASPEAIFAPDFRESVRVVEDAGDIARFFDLDTDSIEITASELLKRRSSIRTCTATGAENLRNALGIQRHAAAVTPEEALTDRADAIPGGAVKVVSEHSGRHPAPG